MLEQLVKRLDEDPGVADLGQRPGGIAEAGILAPVALRADHWPDQAEDGADLLQGLARLVDRFVARTLALAGQLLEDGVHLLVHDPPQVLAEGLFRL